MAKRTNSNIENDNVVDFYTLACSLLHDGQLLADNAAGLGLDPRDVAEGTARSDFYSVYQAEKASMLRMIFSKLCDKALESIETMAEIVKNDSINPATRLQSCQSILNYIKAFNSDLKEVEDSVIETARHAKLYGD